MAKPITYVGLDVHKDTIAVALAASRNVSTTLIHPGSSFRLGTAGLGSVS
jgi:hypothetical protein